MDFSVQAFVAPKAAAKLLISDEISVEEVWPVSVAQKVFDELLDLSIEDILGIVDSNSYGGIADVKKIPQFGKIETLINVPSYFKETGNTCVDYPQLGFFLKRDIKATLVANTKFGETHGKAMSILGITNCVDKRILPSALTYAFATLAHNQQEEVVKRLLFRIPVVQIILSSAKNGEVNGYAAMSQLMESTKKRRGQCLRMIFRVFKEYNNAELSARVDNIRWEEN